MNWTFDLTSTSIWKKGSKIYFVFNYSNKSSFVNLADELFLLLRPKKTIHSDQHLENRKKRENASKKKARFYSQLCFIRLSRCLFVFLFVYFSSLDFFFSYSFKSVGLYFPQQHLFHFRLYFSAVTSHLPKRKSENAKQSY